MTGIVFLLCLGLILSALFSGAETGFYRIPRLRLVLDALQGDRVAKGLLWFTRHPTFFVATVLTGNNLANYVISASLVTLVYRLVPHLADLLAMTASVLATPLMFVYAELLPKTVFLHRPDRILRAVSPAFFAFAIFFLPLTFPLWLLGQALALLREESAGQWETVLARRELKRILGEAKAAGVLRPVQFHLAEAVFELGTLPLVQMCEKPDTLPVIPRGISLAEAFSISSARQAPELLVSSPDQDGPTAYVRTIDLILRGQAALDDPRPLLILPGTYTALEAFVHLMQADEPWARIEGPGRQFIGLVRRQKLINLAMAVPSGREGARTCLQFN